MTYPSKVRPSTRMIFGTALDSISFHLEKIQIFFFIWLSQLLVWTRVDFLRCSLSNRVSKLWTLLLFLGQQSLTKFCVIVNSDGAIATPIWVKLSSQKIHLSKSRDHRFFNFASTFQNLLPRFKSQFNDSKFIFSRGWGQFSWVNKSCFSSTTFFGLSPRVQRIPRGLKLEKNRLKI